MLLLHGFSGSPWEVRPLGEALAARGFHVVAPLLPGHGTIPEALCYVTWRDWLAAADAALERLFAKFGDVSLVGLSMGGLLGVILAARHRRLARLVVMAPVVKMHAKNAQLLHRIRHTPLVGLAPEWVIKKTTDIGLPDVRAESPLLPRYPLARVLDLFELQDLARVAEQGVRCPSLVFAAVNDHVVNFKAVCELQARLPCSRLVVLQRGCHIIPRDADRAIALTEVSEFLDV